MSHRWFKNYSDFAVWVDFAYWWSGILRSTVESHALKQSYTMQNRHKWHVQKCWDKCKLRNSVA